MENPSDRPSRPPHPFALSLLKWFQEHGRDLPWRHTRDPYAIWLSEIILQQTRIEQGRPYWERFMRRWPRVDDLAAASEDDVMRMWQGLGYYSRARHLHAAARQVAAAGGFPRTYEGLLSLQGVGAYTAAAVASIAYGQPHAVVDGNVYRVLSRHFGIDTPINTTRGQHEFSRLAHDLLPPKETSAYNQAIMDFGALQCVPSSPQCDACPLLLSCEARRTDRVEALPVKLKTLRVKQRRLTYVILRCEGAVALRRRPGGDIWQGLWEPILIDDDGQPCAEWLAGAGFSKENPRVSLLANDVRHVLTHRILLADFYLWEPQQRPVLPDEYVWVKEEDIDNHGLPRLIEKMFNKIL